MCLYSAVFEALDSPGDLTRWCIFRAAESELFLRLDIQHVGALISSINALGYDPMSAKGLAVELGLGEEGKQVRSFNEKLISGSEGRLGSQSTIRFASLDGSHGNYASRSVFSQGVHNDPTRPSQKEGEFHTRKLTVSGWNISKQGSLGPSSAKKWLPNSRQSYAWYSKLETLFKDSPQLNLSCKSPWRFPQHWLGILVAANLVR